MRGSASSAGKALPPASAGEAREQLLHERLMVRVDGGSILQRLAREIHLQYGAATSSAAAAPAD